MGEECSEKITCNGLDFDDDNVCSGHGSCTDSNQCDCDVHWSGESCNVTTCSGVSSDSEDVCSGQGSCTGFNQCDCDDHWFGESCSTTTCSGVSSDSGDVCSGHGSCTEFNVCKCNTGYTGDNCEASTEPVTCFGQSGDAACSAHGTCTKKDTCVCDDGFNGESCMYLDAVDGLTISDITKTSLKISWTASVVNSVVTYKINITSARKNIQLTSTSTTITASELVAQTIYTISVNAVLGTSSSDLVSKIVSTLVNNAVAVKAGATVPMTIPMPTTVTLPAGSLITVTLKEGFSLKDIKRSGTVFALTDGQNYYDLTNFTVAAVSASGSLVSTLPPSQGYFIQAQIVTDPTVPVTTMEMGKLKVLDTTTNAELNFSFDLPTTSVSAIDPNQAGTASSTVVEESEVVSSANMVNTGMVLVTLVLVHFLF